MKRKAGAFMLLTVLGGCVTSDKMDLGQQHVVARPREAAGVQAPHGKPVSQFAAGKSDVVQASATEVADGGVQQASGLHPKDCGCGDCNAKRLGHKLGAKGAEPGRMIGGYHRFGGATGGVDAPIPGAVAAVGALPGIPVGAGGQMAAGRTSIRFTGPAGMQIAWFAPSPESRNGFTPVQVEVPGRYNFVQGGIYRLKLTNIPNRNLELYPTLEVMPANARTSTFLAHTAVPIGFSEEDFEQVAAGNLVVKVIYLPNPEFQELAVAGPDEVVSTRLEPGVDPIMEATRRGSVLAVIRMGNIDLEAPNTPAMNAPPMVPGMVPGMGGMPLQVPPGGVMPGVMPPPGGMMPGGMPPRGAMPLPPGTPIPPSAMPVPGGAPVPPPGLRPAGPNAGRSAISVPGQAPTLKLPDAPPPTDAQGKASVTVEGMFGRMK